MYLQSTTVYLNREQALKALDERGFGPEIFASVSPPYEGCKAIIVETEHGMVNVYVLNPKPLQPGQNPWVSDK